MSSTSDVYRQHQSHKITRKDYFDFVTKLGSGPFKEDHGTVTPPPPSSLIFGYLMKGVVRGVIRCDTITGTTCQLHIVVHRVMYPFTRIFCRQVIEHLFNRTPTLKIICMVPEFNRLAARLVKDLNGREEGRITKSFLRGWKLYDMILYGLTKQEFIKEAQECHQ